MVDGNSFMFVSRPNPGILGGSGPTKGKISISPLSIWGLQRVALHCIFYAIFFFLSIFLFYSYDFLCCSVLFISRKDTSSFAILFFFSSLSFSLSLSHTRARAHRCTKNSKSMVHDILNKNHSNNVGFDNLSSISL